MVGRAGASFGVPVTISASIAGALGIVFRLEGLIGIVWAMCYCFGTDVRFGFGAAVCNTATIKFVLGLAIVLITELQLDFVYE